MAASARITLYVSPTGSDNAAGTKDAPFATLTRARDEIRALKGRMKQREIAERFSITQGYVSEIQSSATRRLTYKALIA